jgi:TonB family protein
MKNFTLTFLFTLFFSFTISAQSPVASPSPALSAALQEAVKLNSDVIRLFREKKYAEAEPLAQKVINIRTGELGKNHISLAQSYWNLGNIQSLLGKGKEAGDALETAFEVYEKNVPLTGIDEKNFALLLERIGYLQAAKGDFNKAEKKLLQAVELNEKIYGKDALETATALGKLAEIYRAQENYEKAAPLLLRVLDIKTAKKGTDSKETEESFQIASCALTKLGRTQELSALESKYSSPRKFVNLTPKIDQGVVNGRALQLVTPPYPDEAKQKRVSGQVEVKVMINESGNIILACAVKGAKELQRTSELAAYASKFSPTTIQGTPVRVTGIIIYNFVAH